jgi:dihydrofolate reductase
MLISIIFAFAQDRHGQRVIGADNKIPWHSPTDLRRFKETTMGFPVIMGRKTHDSIGKVLPGRQNIIITGQRDLRVEDAYVVHNVKGALDQARSFGASEAFVIGGAQIYEQMLPLADRIYMTHILEWGIVGDTHFPPFNLLNFKCLCVEENARERFEMYQRAVSTSRTSSSTSSEVESNSDELAGG